MSNPYKAPIPSHPTVADLVSGALSHLFPDILYSPTPLTEDGLRAQISAAFSFADMKGDATAVTRDLLASLDATRQILFSDAAATYDGDPAATSHREVILCYPGFYATASYRLAHTIYTLGVPLLPRLITEHAHSKTGIDIHPGATVGARFCIDHGTGIVIGETATVGDGVRIYHGVTLGAKSLPLDSEGRVVRGTRRHPHIGDGTVIYANATILGGDTTVGERCVIGAGVTLTHSVPAGCTVTRSPCNLRIRQNNSNY